MEEKTKKERGVHPCTPLCYDKSYPYTYHANLVSKNIILCLTSVPPDWCVAGRRCGLTVLPTKISCSFLWIPDNIVSHTFSPVGLSMWFYKSILIFWNFIISATTSESQQKNLSSDSSCTSFFSFSFSFILILFSLSALFVFRFPCAFAAFELRKIFICRVQ